MSPTLIASYAVYSAAADNTTLTTSSFTPSNGEIIVVKAATWAAADGMSTPTGGGQTYTNTNAHTPGGFNCWTGIWVATVSGTPGSMSVSCAPATANNTRHSMVVERWGNATLAATPATNDVISDIGTSATTTLTTTAANSVVSWVLGDENSVDPASTSYVTSSATPTQDGLYDGHIGTQSVHYFAYQSAASAGSQTFGISSASNIRWMAMGVEILDAAGSQFLTATGIASGEAIGTAKLNLNVSPVAIDTAEAFGRATITGGVHPDSQHLEVVAELNRLAGTSGLGEAGAANAWAGTTGLEAVGALNHKAGLTVQTQWLDMQGVCNYLAGTSGLGTAAALAQIPTGS